jgi:hypothetical protein
MDKKAKEIKRGIRLDIRKPPKVETPANVYKRKAKHKRGYDDKSSYPLFIPIQRNFF